MQHRSRGRNVREGGAARSPPESARPHDHVESALGTSRACAWLCTARKIAGQRQEEVREATAVIPRATDSMSTKTVIARMEEVLRPLGFHRTKTSGGSPLVKTWNRLAGPFVDAVDVQVSKDGDSITINAGVLEPKVYEMCWGMQAPLVIEVPSCTVYARVGQLIDRKDLWWPLNGERTSEAVAENLAVHVLPFLERMHSLAGMEQFLTAAEVRR